jgi:carbonic anhydrase
VIATEAASASHAHHSPAQSARPEHWGYSGEEGPEHWARLTPAYAACAGQAQSPIDIHGSSESGASWRTDYRQTGLKIADHEHVTDILDNGHTLQVTVDKGSTLTTERGTYALKQFHFHAPSEHTVDGKAFPMEVHFVHQSASGDFAVLAVFVEEGPENANLAALIANLPAAKGEAIFRPEVRLDLALQLPADNATYRYVGSFTTPPCTENVEWLIVRGSAKASRAQIVTFADRLKHNNRPLQPLNGRELVLGKVAGSFTR